MDAVARQRVTLQLLPVEGLPEIQPGDDLATLILQASTLRDDDVVLVAQKVMSKHEGRRCDLRTVIPSARATGLAQRLQRDPRLIQVVLDESVRIVRDDRVLIVETRQGFICANGGVDASNTGAGDMVTLLPLDCDASAARLRESLVRRAGCDVGVIITDTFGRPFRLGICNVALGVAGVPALRDMRGALDDSGRPLRSTVVAVADELAAAAGLLMGKTTRVPVVVVRGFDRSPPHGTGSDLLRTASEDLFR